ncbi:MAG: hypothetical protein DME52_00165 [Verrucomicrobia bacterium]|nr:MAG: hypothetical protein DME52_00165 [Verrucomicrobiota bacterium]
MTGGIRRAQWANPPVFYFAAPAILYPCKVQKNIGTAGLPLGTYLEQNYERRSPRSFIRRKTRYMSVLNLRP